VGARYQDAPLEIGAPLAYEGPEANHERFRRIIEGVYRQGIAQLGLAPQFACNVVQVNAHSEEI